MMLVNREPGPMVIRSARAMASRVSSSGRQRRGRSDSETMRDRVLLMLVSPATTLPSSRCASRTTLASVEGKIRPREASTSEESRTALREVAGQVRHGGQEKVAEAVALQAAPGREPVLEQAAHQSFVFRQGHHAIPDVAGRQHLEFPPQPARTAAVVGHGHHRRKVHRVGFHRIVEGDALAQRMDVALQTVQKTRKAGPASDHDNAQRFPHRCFLAR